MNEDSPLALRNSGSLNNTCFKCTNKTLHIKVWQSEGWAQRQLLKFLLEELDWRSTLLIFLSQRVISPKTVLAVVLPKALTVCPAIITSAPWEAQSREKARSHWSTVGNPGRRITPNLCECSDWKPHSQAALFMLFSVKILETQNKSEACWHWIMSGQTFNSKESLDLF